MEEPPSVRILVSGIARVGYTLILIVLFGVVFDHVLSLSTWVFGPWRLIGWLPLSVGVALEASGTRAFWRHGRGTPNPIAHPSDLVIQGPYAWSRHPLYLARHLMLVGVAWLLGSFSILGLTFLLFLVVQFILIPREEARLAARFGESYEEYRRRVSTWGIPTRRRRR